VLQKMNINLNSKLILIFQNIKLLCINIMWVIIFKFLTTIYFLPYLYLVYFIISIFIKMSVILG